MKICPVCRVSYEDESYNFCLADGSLLVLEAEAERTHFLPGDYQTHATVTEVLTVIGRQLNPLQKTVAADLFAVLADIERQLLDARLEPDETKPALQIAGSVMLNGLRAIARGVDPSSLSEQLLRANEAAVALIDKSKQPGAANKIAQLAYTAYPNERATQLIVDALSRVEISRSGPDAAVVTEPGQQDFGLEFVKGMMLDRGFITPESAAARDSAEIVLDEPNILLTEKNLTRAGDLLPIIERLGRSLNPNLLIIAEEVAGEALDMLWQVAGSRSVKSLAVKAPGFGDCRRAMLADIAVVTGGRVFSKDDRRHLASATNGDFGRARKVILSKDTTTIVEAAGSSHGIAGRLEEIKKQIKESDSEYDREKLGERLTKLAGGVAVIKAGGLSESERQSNLQAVNRALRDCLWGFTYGFVPGNNLAFVNAADGLRRENPPGANEREANFILAEALETPFSEMASDDGLSGEQALRAVKLKQAETNNYNIGYDPMSNQITDLIRTGTIVPITSVVRICETAVYLASRKLANFRYSDEVVRKMRG